MLTLLISGLIGYFTNYIAVKMLFRPRTEKHIFGKRIPFTPGIIPKNQPRLARALGAAVSEQLLTGEDLKAALSSEETANAVAERAMGAMFTDKPLGEAAEELIGGENTESLKAFAKENVTALAVRKLKEADLPQLIISEGKNAIGEKVAGTMLAMFVSEQLLDELAAPLGARINEYIDQNAEGMIGAAVSDEIDRVAAASPNELLTGAGVSPEAVKGAAAGMFRKAMSQAIDPLLQTVDIPKLVEARVNAMSVEEVEELVMSVMKNELNAVISLGGLIGIIIGLLNLIVQKL